MVLLRAGKACALKDAKKLHHSGEEAGCMGIKEYRKVDLYAITEDILNNLEFYEIEVGFKFLPTLEPFKWRLVP